MPIVAPLSHLSRGQNGRAMSTECERIVYFRASTASEISTYAGSAGLPGGHSARRGRAGSLRLDAPHGHFLAFGRRRNADGKFGPVARHEPFSKCLLLFRTAAFDTGDRLLLPLVRHACQ